MKLPFKAEDVATPQEASDAGFASITRPYNMKNPFEVVWIGNVIKDMRTVDFMIVGITSHTYEIWRRRSQLKF